MHINIFKSALTVLAGILISTMNNGAAAEVRDYGSRFELGVGISGNFLENKPEWASYKYVTGQIFGTVRLYRMLNMSLLKEFGAGDQLVREWVGWKENERLMPSGGTGVESLYAGLGYDHFLKENSKRGRVDIESIRFGIGGVKSTFGMGYDMVEKDGIEETTESQTVMLGNVYGAYVSAAARWRFFDPAETSGFDIYGFDLGVRYVRYLSSKMNQPMLEIPGNAFSSIQVFAAIVFRSDIFQ